MAYDGTPPPPAFIDYTPGSSVTLACGCAGCVKSAQVWLKNHGDAALAANFVQHLAGGLTNNIGQLAAAPTVLQLLQTAALTDTETADSTSTGTVIVGGPRVVSTINTIGDVDAFKIRLEAGKTYDISMIQKLGGPTGVPNLDAFITLTDLAGNVVATADGGSPDTPTSTAGLDAKMTITVTQTADYLIKAQAFDQDATNGTTGDGVGDYELFAVESTADPTAYRPFYDTSSPLHSIDWGSQMDRSSRNPDGDNGTRTDNGVANGGTPILTNNFGIVGKNVFTYYFAKQGDVFIDEGLTGLATMVQAANMLPWEKAAFRKAFDLYEQVADVVYIEVQNRNEADFKLVTYQGTPGAGASLLGRMSPPNEANEGQAEFNRGDVRWSEAGLSQGGFYFPTLLHEFGHGHGMAHPHDNGGRSSVMPGADGGTGGLGGGYGDWGLSQNVFTIMSYNDGWYEDAPHNVKPAGHGGPRSGGLTATEVDHFGNMGTLAPLDIAVLQDKYGVNEEWARGNDVYVIKDVNGPGSFYSAIWDGGGTDEIKYVGTRNSTIDLRAATLKYEEGGGGRMSFALGAWTGFTIANGVVIENGTTGSGNDRLTGNGANNLLSAGAGNDTLSGGAGNDQLVGGAGNDFYTIDAGWDVIQEAAGEGYDVLNLSLDLAVMSSVEEVNMLEASRILVMGDAQTIIRANAADNLIQAGGGNDLVNGGAGLDALYGEDGADQLFGEGDADLLVGGTGSDLLDGGAGSDTAYGDAGNDVLRGGDDGDFLWGMEDSDNLFGDGGADQLMGGLGSDFLSGGVGVDAIYGQEGIDALEGGADNDLLDGGDGSDNLVGGAGIDALTGGAGVDLFRFNAASEGGDSIRDFTPGVDKLALLGSAFGGLASVQAGANFFSGASATNAGPALIYYGSTGQLFYDADGVGAGASVLIANFDTKPVFDASDILILAAAAPDEPDVTAAASAREMAEAPMICIAPRLPDGDLAWMM